MPAERANPDRKPQGNCTKWAVEARDTGTSHGRVMPSRRHVHSGRSRCSPNGPWHKKTYVALWIDAACVQGTPFVFCMGATTIEGRKRMQSFAESTLYNRDALERMLQHLIALGTGRGPGLR